jgi:hypothetical protein
MPSHANAEAAQPNTPLPDHQTETDEMFQNAEEKAKSMRIRAIGRDAGLTTGADTAPL